MGRPYIDMAGQTINGIKVLSLVDEVGGAGKHKRWNCLCPVCGKEYIVASQHLRDKKEPVKMCFDCAVHQYIDLVGQKFGKLTVLEFDGKSKWNRIRFKCQCDCGVIVSVQSNHLISGRIKSCGCLLSSGEEEISNILDLYGIAYEKQKSFDDCRDVHPLRFDFYIPAINTIIEYQGVQHFKPVEYFGGEEQFLIGVEHDRIKEEYCMSHGINIFYINYYDNIQDKLNELLQSEEMVWPCGNTAG